jgi:hypothetical protein
MTWGAPTRRLVIATVVTVLLPRATHAQEVRRHRIATFAVGAREGLVALYASSGRGCVTWDTATRQ